MCRCFGNSGESLCHARHVCRVLRLYEGRAALRAAGRIPESWTPCGIDMAITASDPSSAGTATSACGLWVLVNIIGRWCVKPAVLVRTLKATSQTKMKAQRSCQLLFNHKQECRDGSGDEIFLTQLIKKNRKNIKHYLFRGRN